jgi:hypothetical protein
MKQSKFTGLYIYEQIKKLHEDYREIYDVAENVGDDYGRDTKAYKILKQQYELKKEEIKKLEEKEYTPSNGFGEPPFQAF